MSPQLQETRTPFLLVTGGKGGVGKSTIAANLALELSRTGRKVLLADLDLGLGNLHVMFRLTDGHTIEDALTGRCRLEDCVVEAPGDVHVLPSSSGTAAMGRLNADKRKRLLGQLRELAQGYDVLVGDSAAGIGPEVLAFAEAAQHVWVVTTPEASALTDAYGLIKAVASSSAARERELATPELIINQVITGQEADSVAAKLRSVCQRFLARSPRSAGWFPRSRVVSDGGLKQRPFALEADRGLPSACIRRLAGRLEGFLPSPQRIPT